LRTDSQIPLVDNTVSIAIAIIHRDGCVLIARRRADAHLPNLWEFPGGKCLPGETPEECVVREVREEVGIEVQVVRERQTIHHCYPDRAVEIHPFDCDWVAGDARALGCAVMKWVQLEDLSEYLFPPANGPLLASFRLRGA